MGQLMAFQVTEEQVYRILEENWRLALQETKNAWSSLKKFTHLTELENDSEAGLKELLKEMSDELPVGENFSIESLFPETEVQEINQKANDLIKEIMGDVFADLPQDPENLEAWSQDLHRRFFAEEIDRKEKKRQQELKESIGNSIARRLRERGVTPSQDFDQS
ncbi:hypothetical protein [Flavilitoribacter nigricans]|uniref:hypothetical protein n=1 Tax=Flavilitoribacter nigricans TaxID=70997 RepID=UPI00117AFF4F|nr:hypothetical protein [Flavilitoribacter nigricans]